MTLHTGSPVVAAVAGPDTATGVIASPPSNAGLAILPLCTIAAAWASVWPIISASDAEDNCPFVPHEVRVSVATTP
jgi:hypothetical protein